MGRSSFRMGYADAVTDMATPVRRTWRFVSGLASRLTLVQRFALVSLVILVVGALIIGRYVGEEIEDGVIARSSAIIAVTTSSGIASVSLYCLAFNSTSNVQFTPYLLKTAACRLNSASIHGF